MNSVVDDIKSRINLVDFVGEYVRIQKAGANWKALCPFHHEKSPSFMINEENGFKLFSARRPSAEACLPSSLHSSVRCGAGARRFISIPGTGITRTPRIIQVLE